MTMNRSLDILELAGDNANKLIWRHVWFFNREDIEKKFIESGITVLSEHTSGLPIATTLSSIRQEHYKLVRNVFNTLAENIATEKFTTRNRISQDELRHLKDQLHDYQISVYEDRGQIVFVGNIEHIPKIRQTLGSNSVSFDQIVNGIGVITDQTSPLGQQNEFVQVNLTEQMQACLYLHRLFDDRFFKENYVEFEEEETAFGVKIFAPSKEMGQRVKDKINTLMKSSQNEVVYESVSFNKDDFQFICQPPVQKFLKEKMNSVPRYPDAIWFQGSNNIIRVFTRDRRALNSSVRDLKESYKQTSIQVPPKIFSMTIAKDKLLEIEKQYYGKVVLALSSTCSTVNLIYTSDIHDLASKIKGLQSERSIYLMDDTRRGYKAIFRKIQEKIEDKYPVSLEEKGGSSSYWIIKGLDDDLVRQAEKDIRDIMKKTSLDTKTCITDETPDDLKEALISVQQAFQECSIEFKENVQSNQKGSFDIDTRERVPCRTWNLRSGGYIKIYQKEMFLQHWTLSKGLPLQVLSSEGCKSQSSINLAVDMGTQIARMYLPKWTENENQELEILNTHIIALFRQISDQNKALSLDLTDVKAIQWPLIKFVKTILAVVVKNETISPVCFYSPEKAIFEEMTKVIECVMKSYGAAETPPLNIRIVKGELAKLTTDVIVNSTSTDLKLDQGVISSSILKQAGIGIQAECDRIIERNGNLQYGHVACTEAHDLQCGMVFHGSLPRWTDRRAQKILEDFIWNCLLEADKRNFKSIGLPAFGTGKLGYPCKTVARIMFDTVEKYSVKRNFFHLNEVSFVIYQLDTSTIKDFEQEENARSYKRSKGVPMGYKDKTWTEEILHSPVMSTCCITVTGEDPKIFQDVFKEVKAVLSKKERKQVNKNNSSTNQSILEPPPEQSIDHGDQHRETLSNNTEKQQETQSGVGMMQRTLNDSVENAGADESGEKKLTNPTITFIEVGLHKPTNKTKDKILRSLTEYNIREKQITFMDNEDGIYARVKFCNEKDAISFSKTVQEDTDLKIIERSPDAVINIRAKLATMTIQILKSQKFQDELERRSGVEIHRNEDVPYQLSGDLKSIVAARNLLKDWLNKGVETEISDQEQLNSKALDKIHEDKDIINESKRAQNNQRHGQDEQHLSKESTQPQETHETSDFSKGGSVHQNNNSLHQPHFDRTSGAIPKQTNKQVYSGLPETQPVTENDSMQSKRTSPVNKSPENMYSNSESSVTSDDRSKKPSETRHDQSSRSNIDRGYNNSDHGTPAKKSKDKLYPDLDSSVKSGGNHDVYPNGSEISPEARHMQSSGSNATHYQDGPPNDSLVMVTKENVKVYVYVANICSLSYVDGIVNSTNEDLRNSYGVSKAIEQAAGELMVQECQSYIKKKGKLKHGKVCVTTGGRIGKMIVHVAAPKWSPDKNDFEGELSNTVKSCLVAAKDKSLKSIALPALSSGYGNAPKEIVYRAYPQGVLEYSYRHGKKEGLKEIHFVDINPDIVEYIQGAFLYAVPEKDEKFALKKKKLSKKVIELFQANIRKDGSAGKNIEYINVDKKVCVLVCDSGLMNSDKHGHVNRVIEVSGHDESKKDQTGVVFTEDISFSGKSKSSTKCLERGGKAFKANYKDIKKIHKKDCLVHDFLGGELPFYYALCVVLPFFGAKQQQKHSPEQTKFFQTMANCCNEMLDLAHGNGVKHLCMPVIGPDLIDCSEKWFLKLCVSNMMMAVKNFIDNRKREKQYMVIHIVCDGNDDLFGMVKKEIDDWRK